MSQVIGNIFNISGKYGNFTIDNLRNFVVRARIVQEHSLAADIGILKRLSNYEFSFRVILNKKTGEQTVEIDPINLLPPEQVESAAARVRPVFLYSDGVYYADVLAYLYENINDESFRGEILELLEIYHIADPDYPVSSKGKMRLPKSGVNNKEMAGAWLYGSLLHEDQKRRSFLEGFHLETVFFDATSTVASMMLSVVKTLHLIERLVINKIIDLPESLWLDDVTVKPGLWTHPGEVTIFVADSGTPPPEDFTKPLEGSDEWRKLDVYEIFGNKYQ